MDENETRATKASAKRAANRKEGLALRKSEEAISFEEFLERTSKRGRKWKITGGQLCRKTSRDKGGEANLTNYIIDPLSFEDDKLIFKYTWWKGKTPHILLTINPDLFDFTMKGKDRLGIRYSQGEFAGFAALTLIDARFAEELEEERERIRKAKIKAEDDAFDELIREQGEAEARTREAELQKFFDGTPFRLELKGYSYRSPNEGFRNCNLGYRLSPDRYILHRTDTGEQMEINANSLSLLIKSSNKR